MENWLPDMDLNHDKQIQSLLCYRYTIGQAGAFGTLKGLMNQSSRQTAAEMMDVCAVDARPHPRGEGEQSDVTRKFVRRACSYHPYEVRFNARPKTSCDRCASERRMILPFHEPYPLTPSLSPSGGEGVRRTGEGERLIQLNRYGAS